MRLPRFSVLTVLAAAPVLAVVSAERSRAQNVSTARPTEARAEPLPSFYTDRLLVKLREGIDATLNADGQLATRSGEPIRRPIAQLFSRAQEVERLVDQPLEQLDHWHGLAQAWAGQRGVVPAGHLGLWFRLRGEPAELPSLVVELRASNGVQEVDFEPIPYLASLGSGCQPNSAIPHGGHGGDLPPLTPDFIALQRYFEPAPLGLDAEFGRRILGGRGQRGRLMHIEIDWVYDHEDLGALSANSFIGPSSLGGGRSANHGTGVVGALVGGRNGYGVTGMVDLVDLKLVSWDLNGGIANSLMVATMAAQEGDAAILIAQYLISQIGPNDYVPAEYFRAFYDAVATASAAGLTVLEAAGNGFNDLDDPRFSGRFDRSFRDSGAIFIGATEGSAPARASFSNFGSRIDTNAWGGEVVTTGYGGLFFPNRDSLQAYANRYAGTSSASALIAGTVAALNSILRQQDDRTLTPSEVRDLLRQTGTPVSGSIAKRADLREILELVGYPDGLIVNRQVAPLGSSLTLDMTGSAGEAMSLFAGITLQSTDLGFNRDFHLELAGVVPLGTFAIDANGVASVTFGVPNDPALADLDLYFQGVRSTATGVHVTSSCEVWLK